MNMKTLAATIAVLALIAAGGYYAFSRRAPAAAAPYTIPAQTASPLGQISGGSAFTVINGPAH